MLNGSETEHPEYQQVIIDKQSTNLQTIWIPIWNSYMHNMKEMYPKFGEGLIVWLW